MDNTKMYTVTNRSAGIVIYKIPEKNIRRNFAPGETKRISLGELEELSYQPGGRDMMMNYLQIEAEAADTLEIPRELEYDMSIEDVKNLLLNGSLDAFLDALDFAPEGIIELIRQLSVELPLSDMNKVKALKEKTGFDVLKALNNVADNEPIEDTSKGKRRVQPAKSETKTVRRVVTKS